MHILFQNYRKKKKQQKSWSYHCFNGLEVLYSSHTQNQGNILLHISHCFLLALDVHSCMCYAWIILQNFIDRSKGRENTHRFLRHGTDSFEDHCQLSQSNSAYLTPFPLVLFCIVLFFSVKDKYIWIKGVYHVAIEKHI